MVLLPEPDTPMTISAHGGSRTLSATKILRQGGAVGEPYGLALRIRTARRQIITRQHARQYRPLGWTADLKQHFPAGGEGRKRQGHPRHERFDIRLRHTDHPTVDFLGG